MKNPAPAFGREGIMKNLMRTARPAVFCMAAVLGVVGRSEAEPLPPIDSTVEVFRLDGNLIPHTVATGTDAVSAGIDPYLGSQASGSASAFANADGIGGEVNLSVTDTDFFLRSVVDGGFAAEGTWSDIMISGPGATAEVSARSLLEGIISHVEPDGVSAGTNIFARVTIYGQNPGGGTHSAFTLLGGSNIGVNYPTSTVVAETLQTPSLLVDISQPISVEMYVRVRGSLGSPVANSETVAGSLNDNFGNTMKFLTDDDVFVLPDGYTANSVSASIVNNRVVPRTSTSPVSEPTSLVLLGMGAVCLSYRRRRKSR